MTHIFFLKLQIMLDILSQTPLQPLFGLLTQRFLPKGEALRDDSNNRLCRRLEHGCMTTKFSDTQIQTGK